MDSRSKDMSIAVNILCVRHYELLRATVPYIRRPSLEHIANQDRDLSGTMIPSNSGGFSFDETNVPKL